MVELHKMIKGYVDEEVPRGKPRYNPNEAGVVLVDTGDRRPRGGRNGAGQDMTDIRNKAGKSGCNHCRDETHWMDSCPHLHVTGEALEALRRKNTAAPQLLRAGEEKETEVSRRTIRAWASRRAWLSFRRRPASSCD